MNKLLVKPQIVIEKNGSYVLEGDSSSVSIVILPNVVCDLLFEGEGICQEIQVHIQENARVCYQSFLKNASSYVQVLLEGSFAHIDFLYSMIGEFENQVHVKISHLASYTVSAVYNSIVNYGGDLNSIQVDAIVPKGIVGCKLNQDNKIILVGEGKGKILPNLWIDEFDCYAEHAAYVSKFSQRDLYYLMSRGISCADANYLLTKSFLLGKFRLDEEFQSKFTEMIQEMRR